MQLHQFICLQNNFIGSINKEGHHKLNLPVTKFQQGDSRFKCFVGITVYIWLFDISNISNTCIHHFLVKLKVNNIFSLSLSFFLTLKWNHDSKDNDMRLKVFGKVGSIECFNSRNVYFFTPLSTSPWLVAVVSSGLYSWKKYSIWKPICRRVNIR